MVSGPLAKHQGVIVEVRLEGVLLGQVVKPLLDQNLDGLDVLVLLGEALCLGLQELQFHNQGLPQLRVFA